MKVQLLNLEYRCTYRLDAFNLPIVFRAFPQIWRSSESSEQPEERKRRRVGGIIWLRSSLAIHLSAVLHAQHLRAQQRYTNKRTVTFSNSRSSFAKPHEPSGFLPIKIEKIYTVVFFFRTTSHNKINFILRNPNETKEIITFLTFFVINF